MGRNRKKSNQQLPRYIYIQRKRIIYRPPGAKAIVIGHVGMELADIWQAYRELTGQETTTLQYLVDRYRDSEHYKSLKSKDEISRSLDNLLKQPAGKVPFGRVKYSSITPGVIRQYLDYRGNVAGNREIAYLSAAWSWCYERDIVKTINPCKGVRRKTEKPRERYITDDEYKLIYDNAIGYLQVAMELAYLCRMRTSEVLDTRVRDIEDEGLNTRRLKGSRTALTLWSPRLRAAVDRGLQGCLRVPEMPIVNNGKGSEVRYSALRSAWVRACQKAGVTCRFHDLKAKGISDFEGDKQLAGGHKDPRMVNVYDRKRKKIDATE